jgi:transposase
VRVYLAPGVTDMRRGFDGLAAAVQSVIGESPTTGHLFAFCNRGRNRLKVLWWDGSGLIVLAKRLEKGTFKWPARPAEGQRSVELSAQELTLILEGIDLDQASRRDWWRRAPARQEAG